LILISIAILIEPRQVSDEDDVAVNLLAKLNARAQPPAQRCPRLLILISIAILIVISITILLPKLEIYFILNNGGYCNLSM